MSFSQIIDKSRFSLFYVVVYTPKNFPDFIIPPALLFHNRFPRVSSLRRIRSFRAPKALRSLKRLVLFFRCHGKPHSHPAESVSGKPVRTRHP